MSCITADMAFGEQHSTARHGTAQHSTAQHSTAQHSTAHKASARLIMQLWVHHAAFGSFTQVLGASHVFLLGWMFTVCVCREGVVTG